MHTVIHPTLLFKCYSSRRFIAALTNNAGSYLTIYIPACFKKSLIIFFAILRTTIDAQEFIISSQFYEVKGGLSHRDVQCIHQDKQVLNFLANFAFIKDSTERPYRSRYI